MDKPFNQGALTGSVIRDAQALATGGASQPPLVLHVINRLAIGGLENGLVNLINHMPSDRYRHAIVCLTESSEFSSRLRQKDIPILTLNKKKEGQDWGIHLRVWKTICELRPHIVHTRNIGALEYLLTAALAGVGGRIHGEHGRDMCELDGSSARYNWLRRLMRPFVHRYIAMSVDLEQWLVRRIGVQPNRVQQIYSGVNTQQFRPSVGGRPPIGPVGFVPAGACVVGTVGRMQQVKDQVTLVRAFVHLIHTVPEARRVLRLVVVGEGPLRLKALELLREADALDLAWLPGEREDIPELLRGLDLFVLPSLNEGISNTILEAMATGLPVVATRVGGNTELVVEGVTGALVPPNDPARLADAIWDYCTRLEVRAEHGQAGRKRVEALFSISAMVDAYIEIYDAVLGRGESLPLRLGERG